MKRREQNWRFMFKGLVPTAKWICRFVRKNINVIKGSDLDLLMKAFCLLAAMTERAKKVDGPNRKYKKLKKICLEIAIHLFEKGCDSAEQKRKSK